MSYREFAEKVKPSAPKRLIFYRGTCNSCSILGSAYDSCLDGVSEGQFQQVLDNGKCEFCAFHTGTDLPFLELPLIKGTIYSLSLSWSTNLFLQRLVRSSRLILELHWLSLANGTIFGTPDVTLLSFDSHAITIACFPQMTEMRIAVETVPRALWSIEISRIPPSSIFICKVTADFWVLVARHITRYALQLFLQPIMLTEP
jgi:hypothetical protein